MIALITTLAVANPTIVLLPGSTIEPVALVAVGCEVSGPEIDVRTPHMWLAVRDAVFNAAHTAMGNGVDTLVLLPRFADPWLLDLISWAIADTGSQWAYETWLQQSALVEFCAGGPDQGDSLVSRQD